MANATRRSSLSRALWARLPALLLFLVGTCLPSSANAHTIGLSRGVYRATEQGLTAKLVLARGELEASLPWLDRDASGAVEAEELALARAELESWLSSSIQVAVGARRCSGALERAALSERDGLDVELRYLCPNSAGDAIVTLALLNQLAYGHRHAARIVSGPSVRDEIYFGSQSRLTVPRLQASPAPSTAGSPSTLRGFLRMGFEHILTGYDHVVFLLALLLATGRVRPLLLMVTAFTVGHSLALALVVFGVVSPPAALVEPAIALSVAYVGAENLLRKRDAEKALDRRWRLTLPFGLIHGLGFASALKEAAIARAELPAALLSFNLGVELGQVALLLLFLPVVLRLRRAPWFGQRVAQALSAAVVVAGLVWFVTRLEA